MTPADTFTGLDAEAPIQNEAEDGPSGDTSAANGVLAINEEHPHEPEELTPESDIKPILPSSPVSSVVATAQDTVSAAAASLTTLAAAVLPAAIVPVTHKTTSLQEPNEKEQLSQHIGSAGLDGSVLPVQATEDHVEPDAVVESSPKLDLEDNEASTEGEDRASSGLDSDQNMTPASIIEAEASNFVNAADGPSEDPQALLESAVKVEGAENQVESSREGEPAVDARDAEPEISVENAEKPEPPVPAAIIDEAQNGVQEQASDTVTPEYTAVPPALPVPGNPGDEPSELEAPAAASREVEEHSADHIHDDVQVSRMSAETVDVAEDDAPAVGAKREWYCSSDLGGALTDFGMQSCTTLWGTNNYQLLTRRITHSPKQMKTS